jgi:single-stranded-DNA-specific exonuclease
MAKRWTFTRVDMTLAEQLAKQAGLSPIVAQLLLIRGVRQGDSLSSFLEARLTDLRDPELLPGLAKAADLLYDAVQQRQSIVVYGDYDADGMTAASILVRALRLIGADVGYHVPNRLEDAYGLSCQAIERLAAHGKQVIVTVDCGIGSVQEAQRCKELGMRLIITDHHQFGHELPQAEAIVHPALPGHGYPFHGLCGAGVAFKLAWGLCQRASQSKKVLPQLREYLLSAIGLAAIGTVADVVPLVDENRILVRHGLRSILHQPACGLREILTLTELDQKKTLTAEDIGFTIGPRLNAAGRLGQAQLGIELLTTENPERAQQLAAYLHKLNEDRDSLERSVLLSANKMIQEQVDLDLSPAIVLASPNWHLGVIGVVAGRLAEKHHRPVVMIALDPFGQKAGTGSARAPGYINLFETLLSCQDYLESCGGHAAAAGLRIQERQVDAFRLAFQEQVASSTGNRMPTAEVRIDAEAVLDMLDMSTVRQIEAMAPFGAGNPRPVLCATGVQLSEPPKVMGGNGKHFMGRFEQHGKALRGVAFGQSEWVDSMQAAAGPIDIAFRPFINEFRGSLKVEMQILDWRPTQSAVPRPHLDAKPAVNPTKNLHPPPTS